MPKGIYIRNKKLATTDESSAFPQEVARAAVAQCVRSVQKGIKALDKVIQTGKASDIAKNIKFCMDTGDKLKRLADFAAGKPDSRPDTGLDAVFAKLTLAQALELRQWLNGDSNGESVPNLLTTSSLTPDSL